MQPSHEQMEDLERRIEKQQKCIDALDRLLKFASALESGGSDEDRRDAVQRDQLENERTKTSLLRRNAILSALSASSSELLKKATIDAACINSIIAIVGRHADVSRAFICKNVISGTGENQYSQLYEWVAPGISPELDNPEEQNAAYSKTQNGPTALDILKNGRSFLVNVADLPAGEMKKRCRTQQIKSYLLAPIFTYRRYWGFIGFDECRVERSWSQAETDAIVTVAALIGGILERIAYESKLEQQIAQKRQALHIESSRLWELNNSLSLLIKKREQSKSAFEENVTTNTQRLIKPYLNKLKTSCPGELQRVYIQIIESNLDEIISPITKRRSLERTGLTPMELKIARLIRIGMQSKEIAGICRTSLNTVKVHRKRIRKKLCIVNSSANLQTCLLNIS